MGEFSDEVLKTVLEFDEDQWREWIWERTHGVDTKTSLPAVDDCFPHQVLQEIYDHLVIINDGESKRRFFNGLSSSLFKSLRQCQDNESIGRKTFELLALERHFHVISHLVNYIKDAELAVAERIRKLCKSCYDFIYRRVKNDFFEGKYGSLRRAVLSVCFQLGKFDFVRLRDLERELDCKETCVITFQCLCEGDGVDAIGKYFSKLVSTLVKANKEVLVRLELKHLKRYFTESCQRLESQLVIALEKVRENSENQYEFLRKELQQSGLLKSNADKEIVEALLKFIRDTELEELELKELEKFYFSDDHYRYADSLLLNLCKEHPENYPKYLNRFFKLKEDYQHYSSFKLDMMEFRKIISMANVCQGFEEIDELYRDEFFNSFGNSLSPEEDHMLWDAYSQSIAKVEKEKGGAVGIVEKELSCIV